mgnify:CR=1 FL=1
MRIAESQISMSATHQSSVSVEGSESLRFWDNTGDMSLDEGIALAEDTMKGLGFDSLSMSDNAKELAHKNQQLLLASSGSPEYS